MYILPEHRQPIAKVQFDLQRTPARRNLIEKERYLICSCCAGQASLELFPLLEPSISGVRGYRVLFFQTLKELLIVHPEAHGRRSICHPDVLIAKQNTQVAKVTS